jgi:hypothetical protein
VSLSNFKKWYDVNYIQGYQLDKDLLNEGNKIYSAANCRYIPQAINSLFYDSAKARGEYPQGVTYYKLNNKYQASLSKYGKSHHLGYFDSISEASAAYTIAKEAHIKIAAMGAFDNGRIGADVCESLMNWKVS